jgi:hypothetical protein
MNASLSAVRTLAALAAEARLELPPVQAIAVQASVPPAQVLDEIATDVARRYSKGEIDFSFADRAMNCLWSIVCSEAFFAINDRTIPEVTQEVFLAFDEGEYQHPQDTEEVDPEAKYTRPLIEKFLAGRSRGLDNNDG